MATPTFYHPELTAHDSEVSLSTLESAHAVKARRLRKGNAVQLINGKGLLAQALIMDIDDRKVQLQIKHCVTVKPLKSISIASAIPKGDRQRTMVDMLTQLGVKQIFPLECERSVTKFKSSMLEKWQRWAIEACKQSQNPWLPEIHSAISVKEAITKSSYNILYADVSGRFIQSLECGYERQLDPTSSSSDVLILIGPEGGFSDSEHVLLESDRYEAICLGNTILRTELASVTALIQLLDER